MMAGFPATPLALSRFGLIHPALLLFDLAAGCYPDKHRNVGSNEVHRHINHERTAGCAAATASSGCCGVMRAGVLALVLAGSGVGCLR